MRNAILEAESGLSPDTKSAGALILNFPASRTVSSNTFMLFVDDLVVGGGGEAVPLSILEALGSIPCTKKERKKITSLRYFVTVSGKDKDT
jgi:hypothetical protein